MNKKHNYKIMSIKIRTPLFKEFKETCDKNYETMSIAIRKFIKEYVKDIKKDA